MWGSGPNFSFGSTPTTGSGQPASTTGLSLNSGSTSTTGPGQPATQTGAGFGFGLTSTTGSGQPASTASPGFSFSFSFGSRSGFSFGSSSGSTVKSGFGGFGTGFGGMSTTGGKFGGAGPEQPAIVPFKGPEDPCPSIRDPKKLSALAKEHTEEGARASLKLGLLMQIGEGVALDEKTSAELIKVAAEFGLAAGMREYAKCLACGTGVDVNVEEARKWYEKAIEKNDIPALVGCAVLLRDTRGEKAKIVEYLTKAANEGVAKAAFWLSNMYYKDNDNEQSAKFLEMANQLKYEQSHITYQSALLLEKDDPVQAAVKMREAAEAKCPLACNRYGGYNETGKGLQKDLTEACTWFRKAADLGCPEGMYNYGRCLAQGIGVARDTAKAYEWCELAANKGVFQAYGMLGCILMDGEGVEKDEVKAAEFFKKAADAGDETARENYEMCQKSKADRGLLEQKAQSGDAVAQWQLGKKLENEKDIPRAADLYRQSAEQGNPDGCNCYGLCLMKGCGVAKDEGLGVTFLCKAAENGAPEGMYNYALCLEMGRGVEKDLVRAAVFYKKAADLGNGKAQSNYGTCLENGIGVEKDMNAAARYYRMAAESGDPAGLCNYGFCLETGSGTDKDIEKAIAMYKESAEKGDEAGRENYERLTRKR